MKPFRFFLVAILFTGLLGACGQRGPLYLPDADSSQAPAVPEEQDQDDDGA